MGRERRRDGGETEEGEVRGGGDGKKEGEEGWKRKREAGEVEGGMGEDGKEGKGE